MEIFQLQSLVASGSANLSSDNKFISGKPFSFEFELEVVSCLFAESTLNFEQKSEGAIVCLRHDASRTVRFLS
jgi:hypothetical protein